MGADGQNGVEQQDSLASPLFEASVLRRGDAGVGPQFLEDIPQRGRWFDSVWNGKTKAVSLAVVVVRVLSEYQDFDTIKWRQSERVEHVGFRRKHLVLRAFGLQEPAEFSEVRFVELRRKRVLPARWE